MIPDYLPTIVEWHRDQLEFYQYAKPRKLSKKIERIRGIWHHKRKMKKYKRQIKNYIKNARK